MDSVNELDKAIKYLREQYARAKRIEDIRNPLAWALYQTWRHVDEPPKEHEEKGANIDGMPLDYC